jgi:hypothetical protein
MQMQLRGWGEGLIQLPHLPCVGHSLSYRQN